MVDVVIEAEIDVDGRAVACAKVSSGDWELNVRAAPAEFAALSKIRSADWPSRHTIEMGTAAGAPVFWASDGIQASILIGSDDESWDVAVSVPVAVVDRIVELVDALR